LVGFSSRVWLLSVTLVVGCAPAVSSPAVRAPTEELAQWKPLLWRIEGDNPSYLLGVIHSRDPRFAVLPRSLRVALDASDSFYDEYLRGDPTSTWTNVTLPNEQTLEGLLSPYTIARLRRAVARHRLDWSRAIRLQPWALATIFMEKGYSAPRGVKIEKVLTQLSTNNTQNASRVWRPAGTYLAYSKRCL
jgi:uncharacterized protein YbaP (TraB family)